MLHIESQSLSSKPAKIESHIKINFKAFHDSLHITICQEWIMAIYLIRLHRNDGAQGKYKGMDILHVQIVCSYCIWHRVVSQNLSEKKEQHTGPIKTKPQLKFENNHICLLMYYMYNVKFGTQYLVAFSKSCLPAVLHWPSYTSPQGPVLQDCISTWPKMWKENRTPVLTIN